MEQMSLWQTLAQFFQSGGFTMYLIAFTLAFAIGVSFERFFRLFFAYKIHAPSFMFEIQKCILSNNFESAYRLCNAAPSAALARIVKAGLQRATRSVEHIQNAIDAATLEMVPKIEQRLHYLGTIANLATLLGLLGTILGLIKSFAAIAEADPSQRQIALSAGISEAMHATAFGLVTAIFAMVMHAILSGKANKIIGELDEYGVKLMDLLIARKTTPKQEEEV